MADRGCSRPFDPPFPRPSHPPPLLVLRFSFSPVKNNIEDAVKLQAKGTYAASPGAGEAAVYEANARLLRLAGAKVGAEGAGRDGRGCSPPRAWAASRDCVAEHLTRPLHASAAHLFLGRCVAPWHPYQIRSPRHPTRATPPVQVEQGEPLLFVGLRLRLLPAISLSPRFALTVDELMNKARLGREGRTTVACAAPSGPIEQRATAALASRGLHPPPHQPHVTATPSPSPFKHA